MKICVLGDSVAKGVLLEEETGRYVCGKNGFADRLKADGAQVENLSVFGCTVTKGLKLISRHASRFEGADTVLLEFGGNDCDFHWDKIAADPAAEHLPNTSVELYLQDYAKLIYEVQAMGALPVVMTLPPIHAQRYFDWFSKDLTDEGRQNIKNWLNGDIEYIHNWHKMYNRQLCALTDSLGAATADIRADFNAAGSYGDYLCLDGIHPNQAGQELIYKRLAKMLF